MRERGAGGGTDAGNYGEGLRDMVMDSQLVEMAQREGIYGSSGSSVSLTCTLLVKLSGDNGVKLS